MTTSLQCVTPVVNDWLKPYNELTRMNAIGSLKTGEFLTPTGRLGVTSHRLPPRETNTTARGLPTNSRTKNARGGTVKGEIQNFSYFAPNATDVLLVGDFTDWQEHPINLRKQANGIWWTAVRLERGTHYYRFLVDGKWCDDPECPQLAPNPFGSFNAVRQVFS